MLKKLKGRLSAEWPNLVIIFKQLILPIIISIVYVAVQSKQKSGGFDLFAAINKFFISLFFCMWFVSLYERAKKRTIDSRSFGELSGGINELKTILHDIKTGQIPQPTPIESNSAPIDSSPQRLLAESRLIFKSGFKLAALLQAGVAFEHSIRNFAKAHRFIDLEFRPLLQVIRRLEQVFPEAWIGEIHMLRKIRNQVVHITEEDLGTIENPESILDLYQQAITAIETEAVIRA